MQIQNPIDENRKINTVKRTKYSKNEEDNDSDYSSSKYNEKNKTENKLRFSNRREAKEKNKFLKYKDETSENSSIFSRKIENLNDSIKSLEIDEDNKNFTLTRRKKNTRENYTITGNTSRKKEKDTKALEKGETFHNSIRNKYKRRKKLSDQSFSDDK